MANEVLKITVTDDGSARVVAGNLDRVGKSGDRAKSSADLLGRSLKVATVALVGFAAVANVRRIAAMSDEITRLDNALRTNFADNQKANAAMAELSEIAARTRSRLTEVVGTFDTIQDATERYNLSVQRQLGLTETWTKLFRIGGQSAGDAASSVRQLGASLASNDFSRGLQTLLRQNLDFANAVAKGYGVPVEELRNLAKDGRLTAESFIAATEQIRGAVDENFGFVEGTIGEAMGTLSDSTALLVRRFFETTDAGRSVVAVIEAVAANIRALANDSSRMESAGGATIDFLVDIYQRGRVAIRVLGELATAVITLANASPAAIISRVASGQSIGEALETSLGPLREQIRAFPEFVRELEQLSTQRPSIKLPTVTSPSVDTGAGAGAGAADPMSLLAAGRKAEAAATRELEKAARERQRAIDDFVRLRGELDPLVEAGNRYAESLRAINAAAETGAFSQEQIASAVSGVTAEFEKARNQATTEAVENFRQLQGALDPAIAAGQEYARTLQIINEAAKTGAVSQAEIAAAVTKATEAYQKARDGLGAQGEILGSIAGQFTNALDSVVNFANGGAASISDFARSAVADLQRVFLQLLLVNSLKSLATSSFGGGAGGIFGQLATAIGGSGVFGGARASGGPVGAGKAYLVGEEGPELFVPPGRGNILANDALANGGSKTPVNVNLDLDPMRMVDVLQTREAEGVILSVVQRNRGKLREFVA